jgi:hypothetical protein
MFCYANFLNQSETEFYISWDESKNKT